MRAIFTGIEYAGKTTLIDLLGSYYEARGLPAHYDDHFSLPDRTLGEESRKLLLDAPDDMKERYQRMQIQFHVELIEFIQNPLFGGWFIEEAVYCDIYGEDPASPYYRRYRHVKQRVYEAQIFERRLPDVVLFHLTADDGEIRRRMRAAPHEHQVIREADIGRVKDRFAEEVEHSLFRKVGRVVDLDTTGRTPAESLDELLLASEPLVTFGELALRALPVPGGRQRVVYRNGVRTLLPATD